ncbi:tRNA 2-thiouridine synthesizing protein B [Marinobacter daqiaonensis]|uniref:tRNA 2-thiouridine synthesizing protein B n=1 Tax=Marinobacter daqiaonensis TaxID=650891 RepID=A0A1I6GUM2_9GAMM|nr:DsrH/TusB family sulfur metabolism protein [Marinobacter daqiaonensis]SFR45944.1 tRNA 2-thiouridine synthesizing protein B [Marinobacter daqiaonensis]
MSKPDSKVPPVTATLHLVNKTPDHSRFAECLLAMGQGDYLLLMENAVVAVADCRHRLPPDTGFLVADARARGLGDEPSEKGPQPLEYADMVRLTDRFHRIVSW